MMLPTLEVICWTTASHKSPGEIFDIPALCCSSVPFGTVPPEGPSTPYFRLLIPKQHYKYPELPTGLNQGIAQVTIGILI